MNEQKPEGRAVPLEPDVRATNMQTETDFLNWMSDAEIYIGYARYGWPDGHGFVCASQYDDSQELHDAVEDLSGGDNDAHEAARRLKGRDAWRATNPDPGVAMTELVKQMRRYYFEDLNGQSSNAEVERRFAQQSVRLKRHVRCEPHCSPQCP